LLADDEVEIVDIATRPDIRPQLIRQAIGAGKHVLAQKPLALDVGAARDVTEEAERRGVNVAVNQNGRWAPPWRIATLLIDQGAVGEVQAVTHLHDRYLPPLVGTHFDELEHFVIYDFSVHWIDISRCWLDGRTVEAVRARDYRTPNQPPEAKSPWGAWVEIQYADGASALIRSVGDARTSRPSCPFWVHGTEGTIRGSVLLDSDFVELERDGVTSRYALEGAWLPDGFAGTLGELICAIAEEREPFNSARHNLLSLAMTLAACKSAEEGGRAVSLDEIS
jgi:predicted dehydrogenase